MISDYLTYGFYDELEKIAAIRLGKIVKGPLGRNLGAGAAQTMGGMLAQKVFVPSEEPRRRHHPAEVGESGHG